ncbi:MAG: hypothetical protein RIT15_898 [Pseudomonadota bacterium]|jgi:uncharacterized protein YidB (DUF937 family)
MSMFGNILGSVLNGISQQGGTAGAIASVAGSLLANDGDHGGLGGLVGKFEQAGLGNVVSSWIGSGQNLPISADQLQSVLGSDAVAGIAAKLGINPADAMGQLSTMLPSLVDKLTPNGQAPAGGLGNMGDLAGMLGGLLAKNS